MKYRIICILAVVIILNIVCVPFVCNEYWEIGKGYNAYSFLDMIENLKDGYYNDFRMLDLLYYIGGLACSFFLFIDGLLKKSKSCKSGSIIGICLSSFLLYIFHLGPMEWELGWGAAYLSFGFYISFAGFIAILIASSCGVDEPDD